MTNPQDDIQASAAEATASGVAVEASDTAAATVAATPEPEAASISETEVQKVEADIEEADVAIKAEIRDLIAQLILKIKSLSNAHPIVKVLETALANSLKIF